METCRTTIYSMTVSGLRNITDWTIEACSKTSTCLNEFFGQNCGWTCVFILEVNPPGQVHSLTTDVDWLEKSLKVQGRSQVIQCFFHEVWNICFQNLSALADTKRWINTLWIDIRYTVPNMLSGHDTDWSFTGVMIYCNRVFDLTKSYFSSTWV